MSKKWSYTNQDININIMFWENREYFRFYIPFGTLYINYSSVLIKNALHVCWVCIIYGCHEKKHIKTIIIVQSRVKLFQRSGSWSFENIPRYADDKEWLNLVILFNFIKKKKRKRMVGDIFHASFRLRGSFYKQLQRFTEEKNCLKNWSLGFVR